MVYEYLETKILLKDTYMVFPKCIKYQLISNSQPPASESLGSHQTLHSLTLRKGRPIKYLDRASVKYNFFYLRYLFNVMRIYVASL